MRSITLRLLGVLLTVLILAAQPARAEPEAVDPALRESGWKLLTLPGVAATRFSRSPDGAVRVVAEDSNALIYQRIAEADRHRRYLSWRWRVDAATRATDILTDEGDDRPLSIHVWFAGDPNDRDFFDWITDGIVEAIVGVPLSGRILTYSWGGIGQPGATIANPHIPDNGILKVLRTAATPLGSWQRERIDLRADFERAFGEPPMGQVFIGLSADSEDTGETSVGFIADLRFSDGP